MKKIILMLSITLFLHLSGFESRRPESDGSQQYLFHVQQIPSNNSIKFTAKNSYGHTIDVEYIPDGSHAPRYRGTVKHGFGITVLSPESAQEVYQEAIKRLIEKG